MALVKNDKIEKIFIEPEIKGDPFEVSDADTMLKYISPNSIVPITAMMFSHKSCPYCKKALNLLEKNLNKCDRNNSSR